MKKRTMLVAGAAVVGAAVGAAYYLAGKKENNDECECCECNKDYEEVEKFVHDHCPFSDVSVMDCTDIGNDRLYIVTTTASTYAVLRREDGTMELGDSTLVCY